MASAPLHVLGLTFLDDPHHCHHHHQHHRRHHPCYHPRRHQRRHHRRPIIAVVIIIGIKIPAILVIIAG